MEKVTYGRFINNQYYNSIIMNRGNRMAALSALMLSVFLMTSCNKGKDKTEDKDKLSKLEAFYNHVKGAQDNVTAQDLKDTDVYRAVK